MFKRTIAVITVLAAMLLCPALKADAADTKDDTLLVYWYICGTDLEENGHTATRNIAEMQKIKLPPNVKVLIAAGGAKFWHHPTIAKEGDGIYLYSSKRLEKQADWNGKPNMGDPNTLASFLQYGKKNFEAAHKIIIFSDHGGVSGVCYDNDNGLSYDELKSTFAAVYGNSPEEKPFELIGFDACMTGSYELANSISDFSGYMLGSEPNSNGLNFKALFVALAEDPSMSGAQIGKVICDSSMKMYKEWEKKGTLNGRSYENALSVINLNKIPELREAYEAYFDEALKRSNEETDFSAAFARAAESRTADKYSNFYTDLGLLAKNTKAIMPEASKKLLKAIDKSVVYNKRGEYLRSRGISTYYPYLSSENMLSEQAAEKDVKIRDHYFELISEQNSSYSSQKELYEKLLDLNAWVHLEGNVFMERKKDNHLFVNLTAEQLKYISSIKCMLFPINENYGYELGGAILMSADDLKIDWKKGIVTEDFRAVEPVFDGQKIAMFPTVSGRGHTFYTVPILVEHKGEINVEVNGQIEKRVSTAQVKRDLVVRYDTSEKKYEIVGFGSTIENGVVRVSQGKISAGMVITPLHMTISADATNEQLGFAGNSPLMSVISSMSIPNSNETLYLKWKAGEPFVFTEDSTIFNKPINKGAFFYSFMFASPNGYTGYSAPGAIAVKHGKILKLSTEEVIELLKNAAANAK